MAFAFRTMTIHGKRYRVRTRSYDSCLELRGPGLLGGISLPAGLTLDSPDLRERITEAVERHRENRRAASEMIQQRVRDGKAGLTSSASTPTEQPRPPA